MSSTTPSFAQSTVSTNGATIDRKWLPGLRVVWFLVVLNALAVFGWLVYWTRLFANKPPQRIADGLYVLGWSGDAFFGYHAGLMAVNFVCFFVIGCFIFFVRPNERMALFASIFLIAFGAESSYPFAPEFAASWQNADLIFRILYFTNNIFAWSFIAAFFALFPDGRFVPTWTRFVALYVFFFSFLFGIFPSTFGAPEGWLLVWVLASACVIFGGSLYAQVWRYRHHATPVQKQQIKWLIFTLALLVFFYVGFSVLVYVLFPTTVVNVGTSVAVDLIYFASNATLILLPVAIAIAIIRYRLWDIDVLIRKTLTYAIVAALLAIVYFGSVVLLQQLFASLTGQRNQVITVLSTLAIAALFVPLRNRIQKVVDRRFYRNKYDAQQVLNDFARTVRDETNLEILTGQLMRVIDETMQPTSLSLWLKELPTEK